MQTWIGRYWRWALLAAATAVGAWLLFGVFAFHTLFINEEVDEPVPFFVAGPAPSGIEGDELNQQQAEAMNEAMTESDMPRLLEVNDPMPSDMSQTQMAAAGMAVTTPTSNAEALSDPAPPATTPASRAEPQIFVEAAGQFVSRSHPTEGSAQVLGDGSGRRFLRLEGFRTDNGPDLNVYMSAASPDAPAKDFDDDFVDLGDLKGNIGSQNYEIPPELDLEQYSTVAIWCVRFSVVFGVAELAASGVS